MHLSLKLCLLLLYAFVTTALSQEDRLWHTTTGPSASSENPSLPVTGVPPVDNVLVAAKPAGDSGPLVPQEVLALAEPPAQEPFGTRDVQEVEDVLAEKTEVKKDSVPEPIVLEVKNEKKDAAVEGKKEKKDRKWISSKDIGDQKPDGVAEENTLKEQKEEKKDRKWMSTLIEEKNKEVVVPEEKQAEPEKEIVAENIEKNVSSEEPSEETLPKKKKKPRKWISVPGVATDDATASIPPTEEDIASTKESLELAQEAVDQKPLLSSELPKDDVYLNAADMGLPENITELLLAAEEGIPLVQETIISKKTTVYVTISDTIDAEPLFVNLTGIRHYTGQERRMMTGCLDLSDLLLTGEDAKEVIQRMAKHRFHKLDLSGNNITEFPANTFSPVAFTVRELRLDNNPLASNDQGEASVLQRGGLFHLTELRELNLSGCGLQDMDYFTPWNSNHLEVVDLSNNKFPSVPSNLQFFHKLKKLYLDGNPITTVSELPFALLWNMQVLSLADCQVAIIEDDPFRNMDKLKELSLEGNNLTQISHVRLPRSNSAVKMFLSGNPWHCACEMLNFIEHYHYAIKDIEYIRCASPRWLEGLRTAYLTREILSLDSIDGDCTPQSPRVSSSSMTIPLYSPTLRADRLQLLALIVFVMAALFMLCHVLWARKKEKFSRYEDDLDDIHYIRVEKKPIFK